MGKRILIIKLGAAGDALRTTPMLRELANIHGRIHVTWVTDKVSYELLKGNPYIDKLMLLDWDTASILTAQKFDVCYSADKAPAALALSVHVQAGEKYGYTMDAYGSMTVFDDAGTYALMLGMSDPLKFRKNEKTYQEFTFDMLHVPWKEQPYVLNITDEDRLAAKEKLDSLLAVQRPIIGLNTGAGSVFATKKWPKENFVDLAKQLKSGMDCTLLIMGGPSENERNKEILKELGAMVVDGGCDNSIRLFTALVAQLDCLVTADTLAMHLAIGSKIPTVALFGPTAHAEVTLYGKGRKLIGVPECAPCYKSSCPKQGDEYKACMKQISVADVKQAVLDLLSEKG